MSTAVRKIIDVLRDNGGLQGKDLANIVAVSPATVSRWSSGKATPDLRTQTVIAELRYVVDRLSEFYSADETRLWLHTVHPMLHGKRAIDLINTGRTEDVLSVIEGLDAGIYTQVIQGPREARDVALLDAIDAYEREQFAQPVWRVVREGRDPLQGGRSPSRWCVGTFDVLYTSLDRNGAIAEIYALFNSQPVWPSKIQVRVHRLSIRAPETLRFADLSALAQLGVDVTRYRDREYRRTQEIADAAYFLGFQGLIAPSARWKCDNLVLFTDRIPPGDMQVEFSESDPIDWSTWRKNHA